MNEEIAYNPSLEELLEKARREESGLDTTENISFDVPTTIDPTPKIPQDDYDDVQELLQVTEKKKQRKPVEKLTDEKIVNAFPQLLKSIKSQKFKSTPYGDTTYFRNLRLKILLYNVKRFVVGKEEERIREKRRSKFDIYAHTLTTIPPSRDKIDTVNVVGQVEQVVDGPVDTVEPADVVDEYEDIWNEVDQQMAQKQSETTMELSEQVLEMIAMNKKRAEERKRAKELERLEAERLKEEERINQMIREADMFMEE